MFGQLLFIHDRYIITLRRDVFDRYRPLEAVRARLLILTFETLHFTLGFNRYR